MNKEHLKKPCAFCEDPDAEGEDVKYMIKYRDSYLCSELCLKDYKQEQS